MNELNYHHLRYFWAVAREGNLTRAAEKLHVSQSAVSVQVKKLEESIGHELFDRQGRGLVLTQAGRIALDFADEIFDMGEELLGVLDDQANLERIVLRVGVLSTLSRNFQIGFVEPLLGRDDTRLKIRSGTLVELVEGLEGHLLDVVLTNVLPARNKDSSWVAHTLSEQPVSLIGPPGVGHGRDIGEMLSQESVVVPTIESGIRNGFDALTNRLRVRPMIVAEVDDMAMLRLVARNHEGLSVIPPIIVQDELAAGTLVEYAQLPQLSESFYALTVTRRTENATLSELLRLAMAEVTQ